jgi:hypothetical protein
MGDAGHTLAGAVVGVGGGVGLAVADAVVGRGQVDRDRGQAVEGIVAVTHLRFSQTLGDGADLAEVVAGVVEVGDLAGGIGDLGEEIAGVDIGGGVAVGVAAVDETAGVVVDLLAGLAAVGVDPGVVAVAQGVVGAVAGGADVQALGGIIGKQGLGGVAVDLRDRRAGGVDGAGQAIEALVDVEAPVVGVVVVELALGVVGADQTEINADRGQVLVLLLDDEVAGLAVDIDPVRLAGAAGQGVEGRGGAAEEVEGGVEKAKAGAGRDACHRGTPSKCIVSIVSIIVCNRVWPVGARPGLAG